MKDLTQILREIITEELNNLYLRKQLNESSEIVFIKRGKIKVAYTTESTLDRKYVKPSITIENALIEPKSFDFDTYTYKSRVHLIDTDGNQANYLDYIHPLYTPKIKGMYSIFVRFNYNKIKSYKLKEISIDILVFDKTDETTPIEVININKHIFENHDENGYLTLDDNVQRVYKNGVVKTKDDASFTKRGRGGNKQVFRQGGKDLNKVTDDYFNNWEDKRVQVGKYKGDKYGELLAKDRSYFNWFLQNTIYYKPSPETIHDIPTTFNHSLYKFLTDSGRL